MIRHTEKCIKRINPELYLGILKFSTNINLKNFTQKYYNYINNLKEIPKCLNCDNDCNFSGNLKKGYYTYCSVKCMSNSIIEKNKIKETNLKKYGVECVSQVDEFKEKTKQTNLKKYGVNSYTQTKEYDKKAKETNLKKYGVEHHLKLKSQVNKQKETNLKKYGVDSFLKTTEGKNNLKEKILEKYGYEYSSQCPEIKEKIKQTNIKKYGVNSHNQSEEIKKKKKKTSLEHYGVENPSQCLDIIKKIKRTKFEKYGDENYNNRKKSKETTLKNYGVENPTQNKEIMKNIINTMIERYGEVWLKHIPAYNPNSIIYLDLISNKMGLSIQHALNGGEKKFVRYWVDGYIEKYNICIEWDENKHNNKKQKEKDLKRELFIKENFNCHIIRIFEKDFFNNISNNIDIICNKINLIIKQNFNN